MLTVGHDGGLANPEERRLMKMLMVFENDVEFVAKPHRWAGEVGRIIFYPHSA